jgi:hypothetical protein
MRTSHTTEPSSDTETPPSESESTGPNTRWNFFTLAAIQIVMRTGWIFKTESIVIPAIMDMLSGEAWLRGCLPMLNRFGLSIPPLLAASKVRAAKLKKLFLVGCILVASATFFGIAIMFHFGGTKQSGWMTAGFLALYTLFFIAIGINQLSFSTLQGKLVPANQRGRLMMTSNVVGAIVAIGFAWFLMPQWLWPGGGRFDLMCGFAGGCFFLSALIGLAVREWEDSFPNVHEPIAAQIRETLNVFRHDRNFRRVALISSLFGCSFMLFPHYQALGRERLGLGFDNLVGWVIIQNGGTAMFSFLAGPIRRLSRKSIGTSHCGFVHFLRTPVRSGIGEFCGMGSDLVSVNLRAGWNDTCRCQNPKQLHTGDLSTRKSSKIPERLGTLPGGPNLSLATGRPPYGRSGNGTSVLRSQWNCFCRLDHHVFTK